MFCSKRRLAAACASQILFTHFHFRHENATACVPYFEIVNRPHDQEARPMRLSRQRARGPRKAKSQQGAKVPVSILKLLADGPPAAASEAALARVVRRTKLTKKGFKLSCERFQTQLPAANGSVPKRFHSASDNSFPWLDFL